MAFRPVAFITWPTKKPKSLSLPARYSATLSALAGQHGVDRGFDRAGVGDLAQALLLDDRAGVGAGLDHLGEHVLGDAAGDRAVGDEVDQLAKLLGRDRRLLDADARAG